MGQHSYEDYAAGNLKDLKGENIPFRPASDFVGSKPENKPMYTPDIQPPIKANISNNDSPFRLDIPPNNIPSTKPNRQYLLGERYSQGGKLLEQELKPDKTFINQRGQRDLIYSKPHIPQVTLEENFWNEELRNDEQYYTKPISSTKPTSLTKPTYNQGGQTRTLPKGTYYRPGEQTIADKNIKKYQDRMTTNRNRIASEQQKERDRAEEMQYNKNFEQQKQEEENKFMMEENLQTYHNPIWNESGGERGYSNSKEYKNHHQNLSQQIDDLNRSNAPWSEKQKLLDIINNKDRTAPVALLDQDSKRLADRIQPYRHADTDKYTYNGNTYFST